MPDILTEEQTKKTETQPKKYYSFASDDDDNYSININKHPLDLGYFGKTVSPTSWTSNYFIDFCNSDGQVGKKYYAKLEDMPQTSAYYKKNDKNEWEWVIHNEAREGKRFPAGKNYQKGAEEFMANLRKEQEAMANKEVAERKKRREEKALAEQKKKDEELNAFNSKSFDDYLANYGDNKAKASVLVQKAINEGLTFDEFNEKIKDLKKTNALSSEIAKQYTGDIKQNLQKAKEEKLLKEKEAEDARIKAEEARALKEKNDAEFIEEQKEKDAQNYKSSKAKDEEAYNKFLNNNPSLFKAMFAKGVPLDERLSAIAESIATIGGNFVNGLKAGWDKSSFTPIEGRLQKIYNNYSTEALNRKNKELNAINDAKVEQANKLSRIRQSSFLSTLDEKMQSDIATLLGSEIISKDEFISRMFNDEQKKRATLDPAWVDNIYKDYVSVHDNYEKGLENQSKVTSNKQAVQNLKWDNISKNLSSKVEVDNYIRTLKADKQKLEESKMAIKKGRESDYWQAANNVMNFVSGIETANNQANSSNSVSQMFNKTSTAGGGLNAGFNMLGLNIGGNYSQTDGVSSGNNSTSSNGLVNGSQKDLLKRLNISTATQNGKDYIANTEENRRAIESAIDEQIATINQMISEAQKMKSKLPDVNDGIIKSTNQRQWLVREDGSKVELNKNDNVYATVNPITTEKDKGEEVVEMSPEDRILQKLGYSGNRIIKDNDYYIRKLKLRG